ncbi:uncharacterized protein LOC110599881 isoform X1 [Manihot esculenta]|uniref:Uncharacterized protein n=1 Tax=Manihot esculenta TaxID=3983 RepID=A0ACB7GGX3_MANES|nr:uncharacterized protein LOC110599881 isoform X1 [Manihot esculenta]KAG8638763.1 hypothetical protein MANES_14G060200v8 [Manihot esculenta]
MDVISDLQESILSTSLLCKLLDTTLVNQQTKLPKNMANYAENSEGQNPGEEFFKICLDLSKLQKTSDELEALRWLFSNERTNVLNAKSEPSSQNSNLLIKSSGSSKSKHLQDRKNILVSNIYHANGVEECDEKLKEETSFSEGQTQMNLLQILCSLHFLAVEPIHTCEEASKMNLPIEQPIQKALRYIHVMEVKQWAESSICSTVDFLKPSSKAFLVFHVNIQKKLHHSSFTT